jgi:hypothetical protein
MPQTITRIYDASKPATAAANALKKQGFTSVTLIAGQKPGADGAEPSPDGIADAILAAGVPAAAAKTYAESVAKGASLVSVRPAFGSAGQATEVLDSFGPTGGDVHVLAEDVATASTSSTPLSTAFGWKLLSDNATPLSTSWKWPTLLNKATPFSDWMNYPLLSKNATPCSSWLNKPLLSNEPTPCSKWLNQPLLSSDPTPLSTKFNWPLLKDQTGARKSA